MRKEVLDYIENRIAHNIQNYIDARIYDTNKEPLPKRELFFTISRYIDSFLDKRSEPRWICIPGLRGVGKSTLLAQLLTHTLTLSKFDTSVLFFSIDEVTENLSSNIFELISTFEKWSKEKLEDKNPCFLFLDEVHYDPKWAKTLKTLYDRNPNLFIICTGSSALKLETNSDAARRIIFERLYPTNFTQYLNMTSSVNLINENTFIELQNKINQTLWQAEDATEIYMTLKDLTPTINHYLKKISCDNLKLTVNKYLDFGSLPFTHKLLTQVNEYKAFEAIRNSIDKIIDIDLEHYENFRTARSIIKKTLFILASSGDTVSLETFHSNLGINKATIAEILDALVYSGLLFMIYPRARAHSRLRKSSKYLFISPAIRAAILHGFGGNKLIEKHRGQLLEDAAILYLSQRLLNQSSAQIYYLNQEHSADFCLDFNHREIPLEISLHFKDNSQIQNSIKMIGRDKVPYGLVFCDRELDLDDKTVFIPWQWLFLL